MASSTTPTPLMRAAWTASGACTSGSTAHPGDATRQACGGATTTGTTRADGCDHVDALDADARPVVARGRGGVRCCMGRDDGAHDAAIAGPHARALPAGDCRRWWCAP